MMLHTQWALSEKLLHSVEVKTQNISFIKTSFTCQAEDIVVHYLVTNNGLLNNR
jgi:hypothetical protein